MTTTTLTDAFRSSTEPPHSASPHRQIFQIKLTTQHYFEYRCITPLPLCLTHSPIYQGIPSIYTRGLAPRPVPVVVVVVLVYPVLS